MKKRKIILITGMLFLSQGVLPYELILSDFAIREKSQQKKLEGTFIFSKNNPTPASVQFFLDSPKKKRKDFTLIEKNITLLKHQALNGDNTTSNSEFGKIVGALSGKILYGDNFFNFSKV